MSCTGNVCQRASKCYRCDLVVLQASDDEVPRSNLNDREVIRSIRPDRTNIFFCLIIGCRNLDIIRIPMSCSNVIPIQMQRTSIIVHTLVVAPRTESSNSVLVFCAVRNRFEILKAQTRIAVVAVEIERMNKIRCTIFLTADIISSVTLFKINRIFHRRNLSRFPFSGCYQLFQFWCRSCPFLVNQYCNSTGGNCEINGFRCVRCCVFRSIYKRITFINNVKAL